ncbi:MAG: DUF1223 domain-containing protein [Lentibacter algarum]|uniref:DUF1223 domain-containing protein n=1 Tax=Lentibacter algarum TaxID=576131 RepID=UPI003BAEAFEB
MWRIITFVILMLSGFAASAGADERRLVVVELFTSQGCSSCPPADAFLHELAKREDVLALGMHVDYWDYIGWKDVFGQKAHSERQRAYAHVGGRRSVYTPQMIVQGEQHVVGNHPVEVNSLIKRHQAQAGKASLTVVHDAGKLRISAQAQGAAQPVAVLMVRYMPQGVTQIQKGENAGREIAYANIVTEIKVLDIWDMKSPFETSERASGSEKTAIILQTRGHGPILAAARAD